MPRVNVIVPTCDRPQFLGRAIASALAQSERDLQVLVIDDSSQHETAEHIVAECGDPRVRYIRQAKHRGVAAARNVGIGQATAPYVAFLDDDDEWLPEKLAVQLRVLEGASPSVGGVYTARYTVDASTGKVSTTRFGRRRFSPGYRNVITTSSLLIRRSCFDVVGLFDEELVAASDFDMWTRIALRFEFEYIDVPLVRYTVHSQSITGNFRAVAQSRERILAKHADVLAAYPRLLSQRYTVLGMLYYRDGRVDEARGWLLKAIRCWPLNLRAYGKLLLLLVSPGALRKLRAWGLASRPKGTR